MESKVVVRDDHEARREAARLRVEQREARHERLAAAVAAAQKLDRSLAALGQIELAVQLAPLLVDGSTVLVRSEGAADRDRIAAIARDERAAAST